MTTWNDIQELAKDGMLVLDSSDNHLDVEIANSDGRLQVVTISLIDSAFGAWIAMFSRVCHVDSHSAEDILLRTATLPFGIKILNSYFGLYFAMPLADLDFNEFLEPLQLMVDRADALENTLTGRDIL